MVDETKKEHEQQLETQEGNENLMSEVVDEDLESVEGEAPQADSDVFLGEDNFIEDDFGAENLEDDFFADDDFGDGDFGDDPYSEDDFGDDHPDAPPPKTGSNDFLKKNMNYIIYGVGGLIGAYLIYTTLFSSGGGVPQKTAMQQPPAVQQNAPQQKASGFAQNTNQPQAQKENEKPKGLLMGGLSNQAKQAQNDVNKAENKTSNLIDQKTNRTAVVSPKTWQQPPMPTPISRDGNNAAEIEKTQQPTSSRVISQTPKMQPRAIAAEEKQPPVSQMMSENRVRPQIASPSVAPSQQARVDQDVTNRIERIEAKYESLDRKIDGLAVMVERSLKQQSQNGSSASNDVVMRLEQKLNSLERQVKDVASRPAAREVVTEKKVTRSTRPAPKETSNTKPVTRTYKNAPKSMQGVVPVSKPTSASDAWVLRAAQTGVAWVSKDFSSPIQKVFVGQDVDGLGRVLSISVQQGRWVVETTEGKIVQ